MLTRELLTQVLKRLFGVVTVRVSAFEGRGRAKLRIPSTYFSRDCLKDRADSPVNKMCADRVLKMARLVLAGKSDYDVRDFSRALRDMLYDLFKVETMDFVIEAEGDPDRDVKAKAQVAFLRHVLQEAEGKPEVDVANVTSILERSASDRREKAGWADAGAGLGYGVERFYYRTGDVGYPALIDGVSRRMDALHFCGQTWTNSNREFLTDCLAREGVEVRVGLLAPDSEFFAPFARFIGVPVARFAENLDTVLGIWRAMAAKAARIAARDGHAPARLRVYLTRDFPAKAMYRFDGRIAVCPKTNQRAKGQFMTYVCGDDGREKSAFRIYSDELDWVFSEGSVLEWDSRGSGAAVPRF